MKKLIIIILLFGLFACNNRDEKIINDLKEQHKQDSIELKNIYILYDTVYKENLSLSIDIELLRMRIDSMEYVYQGKHNQYYRYLEWEKKMDLIQTYQTKIDKLQIEMDSIAK